MFILKALVSIAKIFPGAFLGWGLGANNTSNTFGTAVETGMVKFRDAVIITSVFVILGAFLEGEKTFTTVGNIFRDLRPEYVFSISLGTALSVAFFTRIKIPISTSQAIVGAILGVGFISGEKLNLAILVKIVICWIATPIGSFIIGYLMYVLLKWIFSKIRYGITFYNVFIKVGLLVVGAFGAYSLGANNVGTVSGIYSEHMNMGLSPKMWALIGGIAISTGVITYSKNVMETVGKKITELAPLMALVAVLAHAITAYIFTHIKVPVSTSQAIVGAVAGVGAVNGLRYVNFKVVTGISMGWLMTPVLSAVFSCLLFLILKVIL